MATDLGKVGIVLKGTWNSSSTYEVLDAVYYQTGTYIAKQAVPANTLPTNTTYWQAALVPTIETLSYVNNNIITSGILSTTLNFLGGSIRIDKLTPTVGLLTMIVSLNNNSDGITLARTKLFTINTSKLTVQFSAGMAKGINLDATGNTAVDGNGFTVAINVPAFFNEGTGELYADLQYGNYNADALGNGKLKCITVKMFSICTIVNL